MLRFEHLADDLAEVWTHLGLPGEPALPRAKGGSRPKGPAYASYYDEHRGAVADLFAEAIKDFGYEFETDPTEAGERGAQGMASEASAPRDRPVAHDGRRVRERSERPSWVPGRGSRG